MDRLLKLLREESGQAAIEHALMRVVVGLASVTVLVLLGFSAITTL